MAPPLPGPNQQPDDTLQPEQAATIFDPGLWDAWPADFPGVQGNWFSSGVVNEAHAVDPAAFVLPPAPEEWQGSDTFIPACHPPHTLAADVQQQGAAAILQSPPPTVIGAAAISYSQQQRQQHHTHVLPQSISWHKGLKSRWPWPMRRGDLSSSSERVKDGQACWRCRASRTGCDTEDPCQQCRNSPAPSAIPCERGLVCEVIGQGAICHLPPKSSSPRDVPPALDSAGRCINDSRWRQQETVDRLRGYCSDPASSPSAGPDTDSVLFKVVSAGIHNAQKIQPLHELGITFSNDTHREPIINIMWELEDNPDAARLLGIGSVVDLAALLETASLCEITHGRSNNKMPIVYTALQCLRYCLEGIRLSVGGVLPTAAGAPVDEIHAHCAQRNECIVPGLRKLSRYAPRYVKALTTELFSRDNARFDNWLLVFYSLCIQAYVRRGLMLLEGEGGKRQSPMPGARQYLQTAVLLFGHISVRGKGTLAKKIRGARAKPSAYAHLNLAPHPTRPGGGGSWEIWHEEGFIEYLERVFELPRDMCQSRSSPEQHGSAAVAAAGTLLASDSSHDNWDMMGAPSQMQMETEMVASHGGSDSLFASSMDCWNPSRPPSNISVPSFASMTTTGQGGYSLAPNSRGLMTPSMLSFSTGTVDDQSMTDGNFDFDFGYGTSGNY